MPEVLKSGGLRFLLEQTLQSLQSDLIGIDAVSAPEILQVLCDARRPREISLEDQVRIREKRKRMQSAKIPPDCGRVRETDTGVSDHHFSRQPVLIDSCQAALIPKDSLYFALQ